MTGVDNPVIVATVDANVPIWSVRHKIYQEPLDCGSLRKSSRSFRQPWTTVLTNEKLFLAGKSDGHSVGRYFYSQHTTKQLGSVEMTNNTFRWSWSGECGGKFLGNLCHHNLWRKNSKHVKGKCVRYQGLHSSSPFSFRTNSWEQNPLIGGVKTISKSWFMLYLYLIIR